MIVCGYSRSSHQRSDMARSIPGLGIFLILTGILISVADCALAQTSSPASLLRDVITRYQTTMEATFVHTLTSEIWDGAQTHTGRIQLRGDQYRIETLYETITGKGEEVWIYRPEDNQVLITTMGDSGLPYSPGALFHSYDEHYRAYASSHEILGSSPYLRLELQPVHDDFRISSLTLWVREQDRLITRMVALDQNFMQTEIELDDVRIGIPILWETFEFIPPEGVEVIDLRF